MNSLSVIVPIYNEEKFLLESINRLLKNNFFEEILLIDDFSTDNSGKIAKKIAEENKNVRYFLLPKNVGKGGVLEFSQNLINSSHVIIHDADLEYFPKDIEEMFDKTKKFPEFLILGSRFIGTKERSNLYIRTLLANKIMSIFFSLIFFYKVTDIATCYKLFPSKYFKNIIIKENGFAIEVELLAKFLKKNKSVIEIPIKYNGRSYSEGKKIKTIDGFKYIYTTIKYRLFN
jgi:dolichol-phosphate mannosyltransferase